MTWATGAEITRGADEWHVFNVVRASEDDSNGSPYEGQFATSLEVRDLEEADAIGMWGRRRWGIESSFYVEKNDGYGLEHNFCNKARVSRNIYLLMQIAYSLWQLFNSGCLRPLNKKHNYRNMRPDEPRRHPVGWLRIAREGRLWRCRALEADCKWPARRGEAEARGSFVIRDEVNSQLTAGGDCGILRAVSGKKDESQLSVLVVAQLRSYGRGGRSHVETVAREAGDQIKEKAPLGRARPVFLQRRNQGERNNAKAND